MQEEAATLYQINTPHGIYVGYTAHDSHGRATTGKTLQERTWKATKLLSPLQKHADKAQQMKKYRAKLQQIQEAWCTEDPGQHLLIHAATDHMWRKTEGQATPKWQWLRQIRKKRSNPGIPDILARQKTEHLGT